MEAIRKRDEGGKAGKSVEEELKQRTFEVCVGVHAGSDGNSTFVG